MRWLVVLCLGLVLAGCRAPAQLDPESEAARNVTVQYLQALSRRDEKAVFFLSDRQRRQVGDEALRAAVRSPDFSRFEVGPVVKDDSHPHPAGTMQFRVTLTVEPDAGTTAWTKGENVRWIILVPESGTYTIDAIAA